MVWLWLCMCVAAAAFVCGWRWLREVVCVAIGVLRCGRRSRREFGPCVVAVVGKPPRSGDAAVAVETAQSFMKRRSNQGGLAAPEPA